MKSFKVIAFLVAVFFVFLPVNADALILDKFFDVPKAAPLIPFGGKILDRNFEICLVPIPGTPLVAPVPFLVYEIGEPVPGEFYYLYGISQTYRRYQREVSAWALGNALNSADDVFRGVCLNGFELPNVDGVILKIGTSCVEGVSICE